MFREEIWGYVRARQDQDGRLEPVPHHMGQQPRESWTLGLREAKHISKRFFDPSRKPGCRQASSYCTLPHCAPQRLHVYWLKVCALSTSLHSIDRTAFAQFSVSQFGNSSNIPNSLPAFKTHWGLRWWLASFSNKVSFSFLTIIRYEHCFF